MHLLAVELFAVLQTRGFAIRPGPIGDNICTRGIDLLVWPQRTRIHIGNAGRPAITRRCTRLNGIAPRLVLAVLDRAVGGTLVRKAGVMAIVLRAGEVRPGDRIEVELTAKRRRALERV